jgi:hypothetical protein
MGRFDRQNSEKRDLSEPLESVADDFKASLDRQVREILEAAYARASEVEHQAQRNATKREQDSERFKQEILQRVFTRASRVIDSIDLAENALRGMLDGLRGEIESLSTDLSGGRVAEALQENGDVPLAVDPKAFEHRSSAETEFGDKAELGDEQRAEHELGSEAEQERSAGQEQVHPAAEETLDEPERERSRSGEEAQGRRSHAVELSPGSDSSATQAPTNAFRLIVLEQLNAMAREGKSRQEAERFLMRFRLGEHLFGQLDEVYNSHEQEELAAKRRRLLPRLRHRHR